MLTKVRQMTTKLASWRPSVFWIIIVNMVLLLFITCFKVHHHVRRANIRLAVPRIRNFASFINNQYLRCSARQSVGNEHEILARTASYYHINWTRGVLNANSLRQFGYLVVMAAPNRRVASLGRRWRHAMETHYWLFVRGIHRWPVDYPHKGTIMRSFGLKLDALMNHPCHGI